MKYTLKMNEVDLYGQDNGASVTLDFTAYTIEQMLERFEQFLSASGFVVDGYLDIVPFEENKEHSDCYYDTDRNKPVDSVSNYLREYDAAARNGK